MVWPIIRRYVAFESLHLTDAAVCQSTNDSSPTRCRAHNACPVTPLWSGRSGVLIHAVCDCSRVVGNPSIIRIGEGLPVCSGTITKMSEMATTSPGLSGLLAEYFCCGLRTRHPRGECGVS